MGGDGGGGKGGNPPARGGKGGGKAPPPRGGKAGPPARGKGKGDGPHTDEYRRIHWLPPPSSDADNPSTGPLRRWADEPPEPLRLSAMERHRRKKASASASP